MDSLSFQHLIDYMKKNHYDDYMTLRYESLVNSSDILIKNKKFIQDKLKSFDEVLQYFEDREEYEKCAVLFNLKNEILSNA
jgi:hypothetical protein